MLSPERVGGWGGEGRGLLRIQESQALGSWVQARSWPPQPAQSPDQAPFGRDDHRQSVIEQCFSNIRMLTHFWGPCSNEAARSWVWGVACDSAFLISSQVTPFLQIASYQEAAL